LDLEQAVQKTCLEAAESGLLQSAHDCSDGGLAVALAESCFSSLNRSALGADIQLTEEVPATAVLFGETPSRIVISCAADEITKIEEIAKRHGCPLKIIGAVADSALRISLNGNLLIECSVDKLEEHWRSALPEKLQAEAMAAGRE
jgi:phosphoribosylformylglycinamidine synthase